MSLSRGFSVALVLLFLTSLVNAQNLPDLVVKEIACSSGNKLVFTMVNSGGAMTSGWKAVATVYFGGVSMGNVDLTAPTSGDLTPSGGSAKYLVAFDITKTVEVKIVVDSTSSVVEADEGNNAMSAKLSPCEVTATSTTPVLTTPAQTTPAQTTMVQYLPDIVVQEIYCAGNTLSFNAANMLTPIPSGWSASADVYINGVKKESVDLGRPTGGDLTTGSANYLTSIDISQAVEVKIVVDATNSIAEANEGNNAKTAKVACEAVQVSQPTVDPVLECIKKNMDVHGLTYDEAKKRCAAPVETPTVGGCIEKYMDVFGISYEEAKKRCEESQTAVAVPAVITRCAELEKKLSMLIDKLNVAQGQDIESLKKEIEIVKNELGACEAKVAQVKEVTPGIKNPCDEVKILEESLGQLKNKISYVETLVVTGEMQKSDLEPYYKEYSYLEQRLGKMSFACQQGKPVEESPCSRLSKLEIIYKEINDKLNAAQDQKSKKELNGKLASVVKEITDLKQKCGAESLESEQVASLYDLEKAYRAKQKIVVDTASDKDLLTALQKIEEEKKTLLEDYLNRLQELDVRQTTIIKKIQISGGELILDDLKTKANKVRVEVNDKDIEIETTQSGAEINDGEAKVTGDIPLEYADGALKSGKSDKEIKILPSQLLKGIEGKDYVKIDDDVVYLPVTIIFKPTELAPQPDPPGVTLPERTMVEKLGAGHFRFTASSGMIVEIKDYNRKTGDISSVEIIDPQPPGKPVSGMKGSLKGAPEPEKVDAPLPPSIIKELKLIDEGKPEYLAEVEKTGRILGFIPTTISMEYRISAETGEFAGTKAPWWSVIAVIDPDPPH